MEKEMKKLKDLGFKKVRGTEPGFHMYELTPARLPAASNKIQATSSKPQAASCDNLSHLQKKKSR
jgi:hypothetical protein